MSHIDKRGDHMDFGLAISIAAGLVLAGVILTVGRIALTDGLSALRWLYPVEERDPIYKRLIAFLVWGGFALAFSADFRTTSLPLVYMTIFLSGFSVVVSVAIIKVILRAKHDDGDWRKFVKVSQFPDETRRHGIASDILGAVWVTLAGIVGVISLGNTIRLSYFLVSGEWHHWLLS